MNTSFIGAQQADKGINSATSAFTENTDKWSARENQWLLTTL